MKGLAMVTWLKTSSLLLVVSLVLLSGAVLSGCKQGEGEVCQIDDDCSDGLLCNTQTAECQRVGGGGLDAAIVIDAPPVPDAGPTPDADTTPDATPPVDATLDAAPGIDAVP